MQFVPCAEGCHRRHGYHKLNARFPEFIIECAGRFEHTVTTLSVHMHLMDFFFMRCSSTRCSSKSFLIYVTAGTCLLLSLLPSSSAFGQRETCPQRPKRWGGFSHCLERVTEAVSDATSGYEHAGARFLVQRGDGRQARTCVSQAMLDVISDGFSEWHWGASNT